MSFSRFFIIVNPTSGNSDKRKIVSKIELYMKSKGYYYETYFTEYPGHATEISKKIMSSNQDSCIIGVGGDGTINEIAKVLVGTKSALAIIPCGSGNGLARDLKIPLNYSKAIKKLYHPNIKSIDYGVINDHFFFCTCGVGFDAFISHKFANRKKRGFFYYILDSCVNFPKYKCEYYDIIADDISIREKAFVVTCGNASQFGNGIYITPKANMEDGEMHVSVLKKFNPLSLLLIIPQLFIGNIHSNKKMITIKTKKLTIRREADGVAHTDGDPFHTGREINVSIVPKGLNVLV